LFNPAAARKEDREPWLAALTLGFKQTLFSGRNQAIPAFFWG
jgi:hypothetical protein